MTDEIVQLDEFPLTITDKALNKIIEVKAAESDMISTYIRVGLRGSGCSGYEETLNFSEEPLDDDDISKVFSINENYIQVVIDCMSAEYMKGIELDYFTSMMKSGFQFNTGTNARRKRTCGCGSSSDYSSD